jgi:serine phosphatase RsbU (regulator of sigma subunit)
VPKDNFYKRLSLKSQIKFYLAIFCTFAPLWAMAASEFGEHRSFVEVASYFVYSGIFAAGWALAYARNRKFLALIIPLQVLAVLGLMQLWHVDYFVFTLTGIVSVGLVVTGYVLFINFIRMEGRDNLRMQTEITMARQLHDHMVPPISVRVPWVEVKGVSYPSGDVGGDLIESATREKTVSLFVADVSGHGMKAGVMMSMVKSALHMKLLQPAPLDEVCRDLNRVVYRTKRPDMFVTFACLSIDPGGDVRYSNAGHPPILHYRSRTKNVQELSAQNPALGFVNDFKYPVRKVRAHKGDVFVLITDGLVEVRDSKDDELSPEVIKEVLVQRCDTPLDDLCEEIFKRVRAHGPQADDQTLLIARIV